ADRRCVGDRALLVLHLRSVASALPADPPGAAQAPHARPAPPRDADDDASDGQWATTTAHTRRAASTRGLTAIRALPSLIPAKEPAQQALGVAPGSRRGQGLRESSPLRPPWVSPRPSAPISRHLSNIQVPCSGKQADDQVHR